MRRLNIRMDSQIAVLAIAERGSFAAAGKYLSITKSAIRKQIHSIEIELGTPIFKFLGKQMVPTEAGNIYLPEARESVRHARLGVERVHAFVRAQAKDLRIGYSSYLSERLLDIISQLQPHGIHPAQNGKESLLTWQVIAKVLRGELDVGFGFLPIQESSLFVRQLMEEPLMVCLPSGHRLVSKHAIEPEDLANEPNIAVARKALPGRHNEIVRYFESLGSPLRYVADALSPKEALWLVGKNIGLSLMTRSSAAPLRSDVVLRPLSDRLLTVKSGVFATRDHDQSFIEEFIEKAWKETAVLRPKLSKKA